MTKEEYVAKYINLCSKLCTKPDDYTKSKITKHNKAMRELIALDDELHKDIPLAEKVYAKLLENKNTHVQLISAARCLNTNLNIDSAVKILEFIRKKGDRMDSMDAERALRVWRGEIKTDEPG